LQFTLLENKNFSTKLLESVKSRHEEKLVAPNVAILLYNEYNFKKR